MSVDWKARNPDQGVKRFGCFLSLVRGQFRVKKVSGRNALIASAVQPIPDVIAAARKAAGEQKECSRKLI